MISQRNETLDRAPLSGKVALVTGAARGQGRSHVVELAKCGADIIALDSCRNDVSVPYSLATFEDLQRTAAMAEEAGARVHASIADVRDYSALLSAVDDGVRALGCVDVVVANAGTVAGVAPLWELSEAQFRDQFDVNVFGVWNTVRATIPQMIKQQAGGSVILIGSVSAMAAELNLGHYAASKQHGSAW